MSSRVPSSRAHPQSLRARAIVVLALLVAGGGVLWQRDRSDRLESNVSAHALPLALRDSSATLTDPAPGIPPIARWESDASASLPSAGQNAADLYKNAFALLDQLSAEEKEILRNPKKEVDADTAAALFARIQPIMELLRRAVQMPECDWALGAIGLDTPMPHITKAMELAKLVRWQAAHQFPTDPDASLEDLLAITHLGRQLSGTVIGLLVEKAIDGIAVDVVRANLASLPDSTLGRLSEVLQLRTVDASAAEAFEGEMAFVRNAGAMLRDSKEQREKLLGDMLSTSNNTEADGSLRRLALDPGALTAEIDYIIGIEKQMGEAVLWPETRFQTWRKSVEEGVHSGQHPLARVVLPSLNGIYQRVQTARIQSEMLAAAVSVIQQGPEALSAFRDPATERPFTLVERPDGFELQSTFIVRDKPLAMFFPAAAAP